MTGPRPPSLGPIERIPQHLSPKKVWRHFYDAHERWERLSGVDVVPLRAEAEALTGSSRAQVTDLPRLARQPWERARALLVRHHDRFYAPAYRAEMMSPDAVWTQRPDTRHRHFALTPRSVFVVVELGDPSCVVTAFRPHPALRDVDWDEDDFRRYGAWYFLKETGVDAEHLARAAADNLRRTSASTPASVRDLWWLASAVGYGRLLRHAPGVTEALPAAEAALAATAATIIAELAHALDWANCEERLANAVKEARPEEFEAALAASEELVAVADAVGAAQRAAAFCEEAVAVIAWAPPEWAHLLGHANERCRVFGASESRVLQLWAAVESAIVAVTMREAAPTARPASRVVDALIPIERAGFHRWTERIAAITAHPSKTISEWIATALTGMNVTQPSPAMGSRTTGHLELRGRPAPGDMQSRVFVVDEDHPDGAEVTERFTAADGELWRLAHREDRALVIVIASERPLVGKTLAAVLAEAAVQAGVHVGSRVF